MARALLMVMLVGFGYQGCCCARSVESGGPDQISAVRHYVGIVIALPVGTSGKRGLWFHAKGTITSRDLTETMPAVGLSRVREGLWTGPYPRKHDWPEYTAEVMSEDLVVQFPLHARKGVGGEAVFAVDGDARTISRGPDRKVALPGEDFALRVKLAGDPETTVELEVTYEHSKDGVVHHRGNARDLRVNKESPLVVFVEAQRVSRASTTK